MKNIDFKQIKGIKTPESWIENVINIPQKNKRIVPFYLKPHFIASVASLVLCCTICLTVFFSTSNNATVPVAQSTTQTTCQTTTESTENTQQTDLIPIVSKPTDAPQEVTTNAMNIFEATEATKPTQFQVPTTNINTEPKEEIFTTVAPTEATKPTEQIIHTEPTEVTTVPVITETPTDLPVLPTHTEPIGTDQGSAIPTIPISPPPTETHASIYLLNADSYGFSLNNNIYCHIETRSGESYTDKFTERERAYWNRYSGYAFYQAKLKMYTQYYITFYDEYGNSHTTDIIYYGGIINI